jgi:predicted ester cyclase
MHHEATMRRLFELLNAGDIDGFGDHVADDFVEHEETPGFERSKEGAKQMFHMYRLAFPDLRMEVEDLIGSGDKVVARVRATGTHQAEFMGMPAHEHWGVLDALGMLQQLGAIPAAAPA